MDKLSVAYNETIGAKQVSIRQDRKCRHCGKLMKKGSTAITASHLFDKKYNISFRNCVDNGLRANKYKFVKVRHWLCMECYTKSKNIKLCRNTINFSTNEVEDIIYSERFEKLSDEEQLKVINELYAKGLMSYREFNEMQSSLIHCIAMREAYFNEF